MSEIDRLEKKIYKNKPHADKYGQYNFLSKPSVKMESFCR